MSSLTDIEKRYLERLLDMSGGYVLDFTNATFGEFFERHNIDIHGRKYQTFGTSKAKKLRAFWISEPDRLVGMVLSEMLDSYAAGCELSGRAPDRNLLERARGIVGRLTGEFASPIPTTTENEFLAHEFAVPEIQNMAIDARVVPIVVERLEETRIALQAGAYLSVIFLCGSILEALLLGAAQHDPARFNQANAAPKTQNGSPRRFREWNLAQLIDVACEVDALKVDPEGRHQEVQSWLA